MYVSWVVSGHLPGQVILLCQCALALQRPTATSPNVLINTKLYRGCFNALLTAETSFQQDFDASDGSDLLGWQQVLPSRSLAVNISEAGHSFRHLPRAITISLF
jgi:hypothetical protein